MSDPNEPTRDDLDDFHHMAQMGGWETLQSPDYSDLPTAPDRSLRWTPPAQG